MLKRLFVLGAALASAGAVFGFIKGRAEFRTWGIDPADKEKVLPGDDLVPEAQAIDTRRIDIDAPPEAVWPWLVQMGYGRAGWYSYDELDTNHPSADRIVPELQQLAIGDIVPTHPGGGFEVKVMEPGEALVLYADRELIDAQAAASPEGLAGASANVKATGVALDQTMRGDFKASWAFVLEALPEDRTRLIERFRGLMEMPQRSQASRMGPAVTGNVLVFGLFVMARRQLIGIRDRAEGRPIRLPWYAPFAARKSQASTPA